MLRNRSVWNAIRLTGAVLVAGALALAQSPADRDHIISNLQTIGVEDGATPVTVYRKQGNLEAPNWTRDGASLLFNEAGSIKTISIHGGEPQTLDTGNATHCNGSHGLSPDGKLLGITCTTPDLPGDRIFVIPTTGGTPRVVTQNPNSYWHGWSPDGRTIAFARPDHGFTRIHTIQMDGQNETAVTPAGIFSDDPDFSPDGRFIYFNSDRAGVMQIWRMHPDGTGAEQVTHDDLPNWSPHPSPDGKLLGFLSYERGVTGHAANKNVELRLMSLKDRRIRVLVRLVGGAGTMNVSSWAPDSRHLAFVGYELMAGK